MLLYLFPLLWNVLIRLLLNTHARGFFKENGEKNRSVNVSFKNSVVCIFSYKRAFVALVLNIMSWRGVFRCPVPQLRKKSSEGEAENRSSFTSFLSLLTVGVCRRNSLSPFRGCLPATEDLGVAVLFLSRDSHSPLIPVRLISSTSITALMS